MNISSFTIDGHKVYAVTAEQMVHGFDKIHNWLDDLDEPYDMVRIKEEDNEAIVFVPSSSDLHNKIKSASFR